MMRERPDQRAAGTKRSIRQRDHAAVGPGFGTDSEHVAHRLCLAPWAKNDRQEYDRSSGGAADACLAVYENPPLRWIQASREHDEPVHICGGGAATFFRHIVLEDEAQASWHIAISGRRS